MSICVVILDVDLCQPSFLRPPGRVSYLEFKILMRHTWAWSQSDGGSSSSSSWPTLVFSSCPPPKPQPPILSLAAKSSISGLLHGIENVNKGVKCSIPSKPQGFQHFSFTLALHFNNITNRTLPWCHFSEQVFIPLTIVQSWRYLAFLCNTASPVSRNTPRQKCRCS